MSPPEYKAGITCFVACLGILDRVNTCNLNRVSLKYVLHIAMST